MQGGSREEKQDLAVPPTEKGEEGENKGGTVSAEKREGKEETMTIEQVNAVAHQHIQENRRDKGRITNSQKGVTWSENEDGKEMGKTNTPTTDIAPEGHVIKEKKVAHHPTTGWNPQGKYLTDETTSEYGKGKEKSTGAQKKKAGPPEGGSWADHTRVA